MLIIAPKEREVRIEVGYGLEGVVSDYAASKIIQSIIIPQFKNGDIPKGIEAGVEAIIKQISNPAQAIHESKSSEPDSEIFSIFFMVAFGSILIQIFRFQPSLKYQEFLVFCFAAGRIALLVA